MNILYILSRFDSYDSIATALDLSRQLAKNNCNCLIASSLDPQILDSDKLGVDVYRLPSFEVNIKNFFIAYKRLKEVVRTNDIDIVHTHSASNNRLAFLSCRHTDRPLVTSCYDFYSKNMFNYALILGKQIIVHHQALGKHLINNFSLPRQRLRFIRQSLELENFNFQGVDQRSKTDFNIGVIVSLLPNKGYEYFLKAMVKVVRAIPYIKIWIVLSMFNSRHGIKGDLGLWARRLGLSNYIEFLEAPDLNLEILSKFNLLISVPVRENAHTRAILEAQAYGVPVIATRVAGMSEVILDEKTGILVSPQDINALTNAVVRILKDFQFTREIAVSARKRIEEEFSMDKNIGDFIDVYQKAKESIKILVINIGKIQDVTSSIPALRLIRKEIPGGKVTSLAIPSLRCLLQRCPYVDELIVYDEAPKHKILFGFMGILKLLVTKRFDIVFDFNNSFKTHLLSYLSLANKRYGYRNRILKFLINHGIDRPKKSQGLVKDKLLVLSLLGIDTQDQRLELWPSEQDLEFADSLLKDGWVGKTKIVGMDISFKKLFPKDYLAWEYLAYICDRLANQRMRVILFGSGGNFNKKEDLFKRMHSKPILVAGDISATQLACLIKKCDIYLTSELGPLYIAMAMKTPSIILSMSKKMLNFNPYRNIEILRDRDFQLNIKKRSKKTRPRQGEDKDMVIETINRLLETK